MKVRNRPEQIDNILNSLAPDDETMTELQTYIADLEAKQPDRPERIIAVLKDIAARYPAEAMAFLEAYLSELEANQQSVPPDKAPLPTESPYWRSVRREKERKARALRRKNNFQ